MKDEKMQKSQATGRMSERFPALPQEWVDDVMVELRLRDVSGARIMEILTEAEQHCLDVGESPHSAFGPPKQYAASLDYTGQSRAPGPAIGWYVASGAAMLFGALLVMRHMRDFIAGGTTQIDVGGALSILLAAALFSTVTLWLRWVVEKSAAAWLGAVGWFVLFIGLQVWGGPVVAALPAGGVVLAGAVVGLLGAAALTHLTLRYPQDLLTAPGAAPARDRSADWSQLFAIWILPVFTAAMCAFWWFTR